MAYSKLKAENHSSKEDDDAFFRLKVLSHQLLSLCELDERYNCHLSLADYRLESVESITYRMLDRVVAVELVPEAIRNVLCPYMKQHNLNEDEMLYKYVGDLSQKCRRVVSWMGDAPWEAKAIQVIR